MTNATNAAHAELRRIYSRAKAYHTSGDSILEDDDGTLRDTIRDLLSKVDRETARKAIAAFAAIGI